ncbi:MAG: protein kinase domain-containing protein [Fimbriiglobus sp.]
MPLCPTEEELQAIVQGRLSTERLSTVEAHLETCTDCLAKLDTLSDAPALNAWLGDSAEKPRAFRFLAPTSRPDALGSIDRYIVETEIGRGGMGIVFQAYDPTLDRHVALKVLRIGRDDETAAERFSREARTAGKVRHDHLVPILDVITTTDGRPVIVMPLIAGQTLREKLQNQLPTPKRIAQIVREIADGLAALHAAGFLHRDVKPGNILLDVTDGRAKLSDFGLSRELMPHETLTQDGIVLGTPEYLSPEQAADPKRLDPRTDLYSLGITLYQGLTGVVPFRGTALDIIQRHQAEEPVRLRTLVSTVPTDLETICLKCLAKRPERRYESAAVLRDDLDRWLEDRPILARPTGRIERSLRWCRRNPWPVALLGVAIVGCAVSLSGWNQAIQNAKSAESATERAQENARIAEENARLADDRAMLSLNAINTLISKSQNLIGNTPGTLQLKKQLNEAALADLRKLTEAVRAVPGSERSTIQAHLKLGDTFQLLGQTTDAQAEWRRVLELGNSHLESQPEATWVKPELAKAHSSLGFTLTRQAKFDEAATHGNAAIQLTKTAVEEQPTDAKRRANLALAHASLADTWLFAAKPTQSQAEYQLAVAAWGQAIQLDPKEADFPRKLFTTMGRLSYVEMQKHRYQSAESRFREQLALAERELQRFPADEVWQHNRTMITLDLAAALQRQCQGDAAAKLLLGVLPTLKKRAAEDADNSLKQRELASAHSHLGDALLMDRQYKAAEREYLAALALVEKIARPGSQYTQDLFSLTNALTFVTVQDSRFEEGSTWLKRHLQHIEELYGPVLPPAQMSAAKAKYLLLIEALRLTPAALKNPQSLQDLPAPLQTQVRWYCISWLARQRDRKTAQAEFNDAFTKNSTVPEWHLLKAQLESLHAESIADSTTRATHIHQARQALQEAIRLKPSILDTLYLNANLRAVRSDAEYLSEFAKRIP